MKTLLYSTGEMVLSGEYQNTRRKTCPNPTLSTINPTFTAVGLSLGFRSERPATILLCQGTHFGFVRTWILTLHSPLVTVRTTGFDLKFSNSTYCPRSVFMCFVWIWEQTAIISLYSINWLLIITETECVYCAVRVESLYELYVNICSSVIWRRVIG
jgi:hypothetical protein